MPQENKELTQRIIEINESLETQVSGLEKDVEKKDAEIDTLKSQLAEFSKLGTPASIAEALSALGEEGVRADKAEETVAKIEESLRTHGVVLNENGDILSDINESFTKVFGAATEELRTLREEFGTVEEINEAFQKSEQVITSINEALTKLGTDIPGLVKFADECGTVQSINESLDVAEAALVEIQAQRFNAAIAELATKYGKKPEDVKALMEKYNLTEVSKVEELFQMLNVASVDKTSVEIEESFNPGSSMHSIMTGKAFSQTPVKTREELDAKRNRQHDINESMTNSPDRFARLIK